MFIGLVADNFDEWVEQKTSHCGIVFDKAHVNT